jgi:hypothetical protein
MLMPEVDPGSFGVVIEQPSCNGSGTFDDIVGAFHSPTHQRGTQWIEQHWRKQDDQWTTEPRIIVQGAEALKLTTRATFSSAGCTAPNTASEHLDLATDQIVSCVVYAAARDHTHITDPAVSTWGPKNSAKNRLYEIYDGRAQASKKGYRFVAEKDGGDGSQFLEYWVIDSSLVDGPATFNLKNISLPSELDTQPEFLDYAKAGLSAGEYRVSVENTKTYPNGNGPLTNDTSGAPCQ